MAIQQSSKKQEYTYSFKSAAYSNQSTAVDLCQDKVLFYLVPPQDAISIQYLRTHLLIEFESSVATALQKLEKIGISDEFTYNDPQVDYLRTLDVNLSADGNRQIELDINLTPLLKKDNVAYADELGITGNGYTFVYLKFPQGLYGNNSVGKIRTWKVDALFTTKAIR